MAQLLSPVSAEVLFNFRSSSSLSRCSGDGMRGSVGHRLPGINRRHLNRRRRGRIDPIAASAKETFSKEEFTDDYYAVLGLLPDATPKQIKKAYYNCMKACHPDLSGDAPEATNFCMFINEVYAVLSDPVQRMIYDEIHGYGMTAVNPFLNDTAPKDQVFVDEFSCIGCKNCANVASDVFRIEEDFGRARACSQSGNPALVQQAIDSCPVDCIHWTSAVQLSLLEDEMRMMERVNVGLMLSGMGGASPDVFAMAKRRWERLQAKVLEKAKLRMMKQNDSDSSWVWSNLWGNLNGHQHTEPDGKERARKAAAAAERWRKYSSGGADRPTFNLPESTTSKSE